MELEELKDYLQIEAEKFIKARKKSAEKNPERKVEWNQFFFSLNIYNQFI